MRLTVVGQPIVVNGDGGYSSSASIRLADSTHQVHYKASAGPIAERAEAFLAPALVPAMTVGDGVMVEGAISPMLISNTPRIQEILHSWYSSLSEVPVKAEARDAASAAAARGVGCFFSGGLDSFYSVLKHRDEITTLIFVHGFDVRLDNHPLRTMVGKAIRQAASELGKRLIEVETDVRDLCDRYAAWGEQCHGAALAGVALLLSPILRKVIIPATTPYAHLVPWGSHPVLDPLWSTEVLEIVNDGGEVGRLEKMAHIASCDTALKWLRVCWENRGGAYNCCRCSKCLHAMIGLRALGISDRCASFHLPLDLADLSNLDTSKASWIRHIEETLNVVDRNGDDTALAEALRTRLQKVAFRRSTEATLVLRRLSKRGDRIEALKAVIAGLG